VKSKKRILIAPLNWGIGHATRCIPIIENLIKNNFEVLIATSGRPLQLLQEEFPHVEFIEFKDYNINYSSYLPMSINILIQIPRLILAIKKEQKILNKIIKSQKIDGVISDNRYGLHAKNLTCVFITHQLQIKSPIFQTIIQKINYNFISKFKECWIIDDESINLAGSLSKPKYLPQKSKYIGTLSRFKKIKSVKKYKLIAIVSGPEPQRSIFEKKLIKEMQKSKEKMLIVLGKPESYESKKINNLTIKSFLNSNELNIAIQSSDLVISRSGYSTIMDLQKLEKKAVFIPTPGQTEQEFLAHYLKKKKICYSTHQNDIDLNKIFIKSEDYSGFSKSEKSTKIKWKDLFSLFQNK
tara:strand:+ start:896 stop:1957 length:1062 start_codon:yes stop_codon:yes gene_type:complete